MLADADWENTSSHEPKTAAAVAARGNRIAPNLRLASVPDESEVVKYIEENNLTDYEQLAKAPANIQLVMA